MSRRSLSTRGMEPPRRIRPLMDVDPSHTHIDNVKRQEFSANDKKFRRITEQVFYTAFMPRQYGLIPDKRAKMDKVNNVISPFKLVKLTYMACSEKEKQEFDKMQTPNIDVQECCYLLKDNPKEAMREAMKHKHLECFKIAHIKGAKLPDWGCYTALGNDCVEILQYCYENNCEFFVDLAFKESAINGHLPCFEYIHKIGGILNEEVMKCVVIHGNLDCLKYLLQNGCKWTSDMCALSAISGDLDFVKFCQNNGCPWVIVNPSQWYLLAANLGLISMRRDREAVDFIEAMKKCAHYIDTTAKLEERCKLKNYSGFETLSISI